MLTLLIGMAAAAAQVWFVYENRDEAHGMTMDDLRAAYHGLDRPAPMLSALQRSHPAGLPKASRDVLEKWLRGGRITEDYESIDLGATSPSEIIATNCVSCHGQSVAAAKGGGVRLGSPEEVKKQASAKRVNPNPVNILAVSTHTHALALVTLSAVLLGLLWHTRLARGLIGVLTTLNGLALLVDIGSWWVTRQVEGSVWGIAAGGAVYNLTVVLIALLVVGDLWWPRRAGSRAIDGI